MSESVLFTVNILNQKFSLILINKFLWRHTIVQTVDIFKKLHFILLFLRKWTLTFNNFKLYNVYLKF